MIVALFAFMVLFMTTSNILYLIFNALKLKTKRKKLKKRKSRTQKLPYLKIFDEVIGGLLFAFFNKFSTDPN